MSFSSQTILIIGLAREGRAAAQWLAARGARVIASDLRPPAEDVREELARLGVEVVIGPQTEALLQGVDALAVSPGVPQEIPLLQGARARNLPLTSEPRLFAQACPAPIVGVTGSSGKTTTTTLAARMLQASGRRVWLGGNIGDPLLPRLEDIRSDDRAVMELSSFQLLYWGETAAWSGAPSPWNDPAGVSPHVAAMLNLTPNHLDRHPSMAHYAAAKANILAFQSSDDWAVLNREDAMIGAWARSGRVSISAGDGQPAWAFDIPGQVVTFGFQRPAQGDGSWLEDGWIALRWADETYRVLPVDGVRLRGRHNLANALAATVIAAAAGATPEGMAEALAAFQGVPHRLEEVARIDGVLWVNDSIATAPERALAALRSFQEPIVLLAGGRDKHLPWDAWAEEVHRRVRVVIAFGEARPIIEGALAHRPPGSRLQAFIPTTDLPAAVREAARVARPGEVALLAPGGTSFDAYQDFAARGQHFRELVQALIS
ncbi:MAG TPA: UDP-N-acetylmuramoyl-L-alanine--D-glutamate ligase [Caldilineae bacterium]|nr:UDP-N-acetylmuramoyl-L-alanine--D-glutamate ligase [Caldilineae bacterium]HIQ11548.1 UDP-N-acetylmuramoyl-L-alanine--D-glutamate ligase [Caldilineales bacterium]